MNTCKGLMTTEQLKEHDFRQGPPLSTGRFKGHCRYIDWWKQNHCFAQAKDGGFCGIHRRMIDRDALKYVFGVSTAEANIMLRRARGSLNER